MNRCKSGCDAAALVVIAHGSVSEDRVIIQCCTCQYATAILSRAEASAAWNKENP